jgi:hypothetical protein
MWYSKTRGALLASIREAGGLNRALQHMQQGPFTTMSGHTEAGSTPEERARNNQRTQRLKEMLKQHGYGYIPTVGGWRGDNTGGQHVRERSFLIPGMKEEDADKFGEALDQEAVLIGEGGGYRVKPIKERGEDWAKGQVNQDFHTVREGEDPDYFTEVGKRKFVFQPKPATLGEEAPRYAP